MICISSLQKLPAFDPVYPFFHFLYSSVLELSHALNLQQYTIWQDTGKYDSSKISFHDNQYVRICSCLTQKQEFPICYQRCIKLMTTYWSKQWATACQAVKLQCDVLNVTLITLAVFTLHCVLCLLAMGSCQWNVVRTGLGRWSQVRSITVLFFVFLTGLTWSTNSCVGCWPYLCDSTRWISRHTEPHKPCMDWHEICQMALGWMCIS